MGELANKSGDEFMLTMKVCDQFPANSKQQSLCFNKTAKQWLSKGGKKYEHIPLGYYITGNDLARTFIEKTK